MDRNKSIIIAAIMGLVLIAMLALFSFVNSIAPAKPMEAPTELALPLD